MACIISAHIVLACIVMAYVGMANMVVTYVVVTAAVTTKLMCLSCQTKLLAAVMTKMLSLPRLRLSYEICLCHTDDNCYN